MASGRPGLTMRRAFLSLLGLALIPAGASAQVAPLIEATLRGSPDYSVQAFYRNRGYAPLWIRDGAVLPGAQHIAQILRRAGLDGMESSDALAMQVEHAIAQAGSGVPADLAVAEVALSRAWVGYVRMLRRRVDVGTSYVDPALAPATPFAAAILTAAASAPSLTQHLDAVSELNPLYGRLREGLAAWQTRWGTLPRVVVPAGAPLAPGSSGERVRLLRERLGLPPGGIFDQATAAALAAFKQAHGLDARPVADAATIAALNVDPAQVERRLRLNLDRARELPAGRAGRYILVDAVSARLWLYQNGLPVDSMKVIIGKPTEQTPMVAGLIRSIVLNPYWNVPPDLVQRRIAPNVVTLGAGYLRDKRYEALSDWSEQARHLAPQQVDWPAVIAGRSELRVRQLPGPGNAMGTMKFMFPNIFGVYLHDTPDKALFAHADRRLSSGCIRLEDAGRLAKWLFGTSPRPSAHGVDESVPLAEPVAVYVTYLTAGWDGPSFALRRDVYDRDATILSAQYRDRGPVS